MYAHRLKPKQNLPQMQYMRCMTSCVVYVLQPWKLITLESLTPYASSSLQAYLPIHLPWTHYARCVNKIVSCNCTDTFLLSIWHANSSAVYCLFRMNLLMKLSITLFYSRSFRYYDFLHSSPTVLNFHLNTKVLFSHEGLAICWLFFWNLIYPFPVLNF